MQYFKLLITVSLLALGLNHFNQFSRAGNQGFVPVSMPLEAAQNPGKVLIYGLSAQECNRRYGPAVQQIVNQLESRKIPYQVTLSIHYSPASAQTNFAQLEQATNGDMPMVFVNGKVKVKPTGEEIAAEYRKMTGR